MRCSHSALAIKCAWNDLYESSGQRLPYPDQNMSSEFVNRWREPGERQDHYTGFIG